MRDDRQREFFKFLEALAEIFLTVVGARLRQRGGGGNGVRLLKNNNYMLNKLPKSIRFD
jgi:hypothetical protein